MVDATVISSIIIGVNMITTINNLPYYYYYYCFYYYSQHSQRLLSACNTALCM